MFKITNNPLMVLKVGTGEWHSVDSPEYLAWLAEGNTPEPADTPDPKLTIRAQIQQLEQAQLMPRATREFMLLFCETNNLTAMPGYPPLKAFDDQIKALRDHL
jgi:hypothetical protein